MSGEELRAADRENIVLLLSDHGIDRATANDIISDRDLRAALAAPSTPEPSGLLRELATVGDEHAELSGRAYFAIKALQSVTATGGLRAALEPCFAERTDCVHGTWEAVSDDHFGEHLRAALAAPSTPEPSGLREAVEALPTVDYPGAFDRGAVRFKADVLALLDRAAPSTEPAPDTCGVLARCGRPKDHRGHHGGWRT